MTQTVSRPGAGAQQVLLAHHLVQDARAHPDRQGTAGRIFLLAVFRRCGKEVGLHTWKPKAARRHRDDRRLPGGRADVRDRSVDAGMHLLLRTVTTAG